MLILKFYTVPVRLRSVTNFLNHVTLQCKHVSNFFNRENMTSFLNYVTATLRALFAWRGSYRESSPMDDFLYRNSSPRGDYPVFYIEKTVPLEQKPFPPEYFLYRIFSPRIRKTIRILRYKCSSPLKSFAFSHVKF